ncbi:MAG: hypothetical protein FJ000_03585 [Actinobacteria bacterium]|nr:hypothetical protein [Actinomycetota bacterium]
MARVDDDRAHLEAELAKRLEMVEEPEYEGAVLTRGQHLLLFCAGIVVPGILLAIGWVVK